MRVLVGESERTQRRLLEATLERWGYEVICCSDGEEAWSLLDGPQAPTLAILAWMLPGLDGVEICRRLRRERLEPYRYVLLLTSRDAREDVVAGLRAGADDYLVKPFDRQELRARLWVGRRILSLQEQMLTQQRELQMRAERDPLTRQFNRGAILQMLQRELERARSQADHLSIGLADLDHFKRINDTMGHLVGDRVLAETGARMASLLRPPAGLGRYGGEEFLVILPGRGLERAGRVAEELRRAISQTAIDVGGRQCEVTASFGVAGLESEEELDVDGLIRVADEALYRAKSGGRNRVEFGRLP